MDMLANGYGYIRKRSKTLKQTLFDWMLHKFNVVLTRTMSDLPSSSRPRSRTEDYEVDEESNTSDDSSSDDIYPTYMVEFESNDSSEENFECYQSDNDEEETTSHSWRSTASSEKSSGSACSEPEDPTKIPSTSTNEESTDDTSVSPIPVKVPVKPVDVVVKELINIDEHEKRLKDLQKELEFIKTTEWMYKPIDSYIY
ncbi:uncharacterized protein LOC126836438 isoform X2 [Adelges cooleyi]|uniref:uncharacterized protein LOC126836438 isoform X2 n=1 Tax=Adelges cooleyi TaxID=133065 RepID=UPI00217FA39B|nr:uncharacterized protein LOC126836438 isoform X2 [Adelges cooleyi]